LPFIAWAIGSLCAFLVEFWLPGLSTAISAAVVGGVAYYGLAIAGGADEKAPRAA
jgi:cytosine permease